MSRTHISMYMWMGINTDISNIHVCECLHAIAQCSGSTIELQFIFLLIIYTYISIIYKWHEIRLQILQQKQQQQTIHIRHITLNKISFCFHSLFLSLSLSFSFYF
jgi:hypothetical protein